MPGWGEGAPWLDSLIRLAGYKRPRSLSQKTMDNILET